MSAIDSEARRGTRLAWAMFIALVVSFVGYCSASWEEPRWLGRYFRQPGFAGAPALRWEENLAFDWGRGAPIAGFPTDHFSVRWETCLVLPARRSVAFLLTSDDGTSLYVDGKLLVDNRGGGPIRTRGADVTLGAGVHHLRMDYEEQTGNALAALNVSLDGRAPRPPPVGALLRPRTGSPDGPCPRPR